LTTSPFKVVGAVQVAVKVGRDVEVRVKVAGAEGTLAKSTVKAGDRRLSPTAFTEDT
jgi:hypothetical protein